MVTDDETAVICGVTHGIAYFGEALSYFPDAYIATPMIHMS
jgi:hypothetical protein